MPRPSPVVATLAVLASVLVLAQAGSLEEGTACKSGTECRSFFCVNGRCLGAGKACTATAATRAECKNAQFAKASCAPGKFDRILTTLSIREGMEKGPAQQAACFNATVPGLDVARCVAVNDGSKGRYGLQCGAVLVRGLNDGDPPPARPSASGSGGGMVLARWSGGLAAAAGVALAALLLAA